MSSSEAIFRRVLCVDDSRHIRAVIEELMPEGFEFWGASDGVEALEFITASKFDLIILDVDMPRLNGIELLRQARSIEVTTPVILYTGESRSKRIREFMKLGIDDFILKPCDPVFLKEKIIFVATQRAVQVNESSGEGASASGPTQVVPAQSSESMPAPPVMSAPPTVEPSAAASDSGGGEGITAIFVVQQVRYPSRIYDIDKPSIVIGRGVDADLRLPHQSVSRKHAKVEYEGGKFVLKDLGSANGTLVQDEPIKEYVLDCDDVVHIGDYFLCFKAETTKGAHAWMENYSVCDKEAAKVEGQTRMLSPEALQEAMAHVSLRNSTILVRGDDESCIYTLGEMLHSFGAGGIPCDGVRGSADVHVFWDGDAHRVKRLSADSQVVWVNGEMIREKVLSLGDEIRIGDTYFYYKIGG